MNRRLAKEVQRLCVQQGQRELLDNDYLVWLDESDTSRLHTIIRAPRDSVYRHKFLRLDFVIPDNYPHSPPSVTLVKWDSSRIHPNMYQDGKCCATILNTWGDDRLEKWTSSMGIETILVTFQSFLDNQPYTYEPGGRDDASYTVYVAHQSWHTLLLSYLQNERIELFREYMNNYLLMYIDSVFSDLTTAHIQYPPGYYNSRCFEIDDYTIDYARISDRLQYYYNYMEFTSVTDRQPGLTDVSFAEFLTTEYTCSVCFDTIDTTTLDNTSAVSVVVLPCTHRFHTHCLQEHTRTNHNICPMCRRDLNLPERDEIRQPEPPSDQTIINPETRRRIRVGGRVYADLKRRRVI